MNKVACIPKYSTYARARSNNKKKPAPNKAHADMNNICQSDETSKRQPTTSMEQKILNTQIWFVWLYFPNSIGETLTATMNKFLWCDTTIFPMQFCCGKFQCIIHIHVAIAICIDTRECVYSQTKSKHIYVHALK